MSDRTNGRRNQNKARKDTKRGREELQGNLNFLYFRSLFVVASDQSNFTPYILPSL